MTAPADYCVLAPKQIEFAQIRVKKCEIEQFLVFSFFFLYFTAFTLSHCIQTDLFVFYSMVKDIAKSLNLRKRRSAMVDQECDVRVETCDKNVNTVGFKDITKLFIYISMLSSLFFMFT